MTTAPDRSPAARRALRYWVGILAITVLGAALTWAQLDWFILPSADSTTYAILAEALATGQGYRLISEPTQPPMNFYPPGLPLLLAGIVRGAMGLGWTPAEGLLDLVLPLKFVPWLSFVASIPLLICITRRRAGPAVALTVGLLWAVNPVAGAFANAIMAEMPLIALSLLAIVLLEPVHTHPHRLRWAVMGGLVLAAAFYMRTSAMFLVLSALAWLVLRRQVRMALVVGVVAALCAAPWFVRSAANPASGSPTVGSYFDQLLAVETYAAPRVDAAGLVQRGLANADEYWRLHVPATVWPHSTRLPDLGRMVVGTLLGLLAACGLVQGWRRGPGLAEVYLVIFVAATLMWPWRGSRFLLPALPLLLLALVVGGSHLLDRLAPRLRRGHGVRWVARLLAVLLVVSPLWVSIGAAGANLAHGCRVAWATALANQPGWTGYLDALAWLHAESASDAVIMGRNARMAYLLIQRHGVDYPFTADPTALADAIAANGVGYIIEDQFTWTDTTRLFLRPARQGLRDRFVLVYSTESPATRVWRVLPEEKR